MFENNKDMESEIAACIKNLTSKTIDPSNASFVRKFLYHKEFYQGTGKQNTNSKLPSASANLWFQTQTGACWFQFYVLKKCSRVINR